MARLWPAGFGWHPSHPAFERMVPVIYASQGVFLLPAARRPEPYRPIVDFTAVSGVAHSPVMVPDAWREPENRLHLATDIPALLLPGLTLLILRPAATDPAARPCVPSPERR